MKKGIHPENYRLVVFTDTSCDHSFLTRSTVETSETIKWEDGKEYPLLKIEISNTLDVTKRCFLQYPLKLYLHFSECMLQ